MINGTVDCIIFSVSDTINDSIVDDLRRSVWPLLLGVDREQCDPVPTLKELSTHPEYNQGSTFIAMRSPASEIILVFHQSYLT